MKDAPDDRIADPWGARTPYAPGTPWPERTDLHLADGLTEDDVERWVPSASILHSNGDAMDIAVRDGVVFVPFHYGYWDTPAGHRPPDGSPGRAANESTITDWDPLSKQPLFKTAAARITLAARRGTPETAAAAGDAGSGT
ncbi:hypothetical protein HCJ93_17980 [Streptomyces sp. SBST2-5]|uniref:Molybdopterin dinucleotide-binding domain-containing protein n=1 Tax=Streptomyces composti TaxID=2720025 RepID=A0ABX1AA43_9ACTN|nr:hypothetical protein [Streptomyces composti]